MIGATSLLRGVPGVPNLLLRFMPAGQAVANYDRAWMALVLTAQAFVGVVAGILVASVSADRRGVSHHAVAGARPARHAESRCRIRPADADHRPVLGNTRIRITRHEGRASRERAPPLPIVLYDGERVGVRGRCSHRRFDRSSLEAPQSPHAPLPLSPRCEEHRGERARAAMRQLLTPPARPLRTPA